MNAPPKQAAIDLDELGDKRLSEISAAEFLQALEQAEALGAPVAAEDVTVKDAAGYTARGFRPNERSSCPGEFAQAVSAGTRPTSGAGRVMDASAKSAPASTLELEVSEDEICAR